VENEDCRAEASGEGGLSVLFPNHVSNYASASQSLLGATRNAKAAAEQAKPV